MGGYITGDAVVVDAIRSGRLGLHLHHLAAAGPDRRRAGQRQVPQAASREVREAHQERAATLKAMLKRGRPAGDGQRPATSSRCWSATPSTAR